MTAHAPSTERVWSDLRTDLWRFVRRRVSDDHVADDLLQETFVRIHRHIDSLMDASRTAAWVYQIARNVIHDHFRSLAREAFNLGDADPAEKPGDRVSRMRCHSAEWMDELIAELPEPYREALRLADVEGLTQQEVADGCGLSLSGAKSRVQRGRALLKAVLERCCWFEFDRRGNVVDIDPKPDRAVCRHCDDHRLT